jgi:hypothetical protein
MNIDELMSQVPIGQLAAQLGLNEADTEEAVRNALPALVGGMKANAADPAGAESLARALGQHDGSLLDGGVDVGQIDTDDGKKIVDHIFGDNEEAVVNQLGGVGALDAGSIAKLLPMLAPLLMSFLGQGFGGGGQQTSSGDSDAGGGLGDLLGGLLGGGGGGGGGGFGDIGDLLGGLLGKGKP